MTARYSGREHEIDSAQAVAHDNSSTSAAVIDHTEENPTLKGKERAHSIRKDTRDQDPICATHERAEVHSEALWPLQPPGGGQDKAKGKAKAMPEDDASATWAWGWPTTMTTMGECSSSALVGAIHLQPRKPPREQIPRISLAPSSSFSSECFEALDHLSVGEWECSMGAYSEVPRPFESSPSRWLNIKPFPSFGAECFKALAEKALEDKIDPPRAPAKISPPQRVSDLVRRTHRPRPSPMRTMTLSPTCLPNESLTAQPNVIEPVIPLPEPTYPPPPPTVVSAVQPPEHRQVYSPRSQHLLEHHSAPSRATTATTATTELARARGQSETFNEDHDPPFLSQASPRYFERPPQPPEVLTKDSTRRFQYHQAPCGNGAWFYWDGVSWFLCDPSLWERQSRLDGMRVLLEIWAVFGSSGGRVS